MVCHRRTPNTHTEMSELTPEQKKMPQYANWDEYHTNWDFFPYGMRMGGYVTCNKCGGQRFQTHNQKQNLECNTIACGGTRPVKPNLREEMYEQWRKYADGQRKIKRGDWVCAGCSFDVFGSKKRCPKCGMRKGDWICPKCNFMVFASKAVCPKC